MLNKLQIKHTAAFSLERRINSPKSPNQNNFNNTLKFISNQNSEISRKILKNIPKIMPKSRYLNNILII